MSKCYKEYLKKQYENPNAIILMQIGEFLVAYGITAKVVADLLDLTLTMKLCEQQKIYMVGFPIKNSEYLEKINNLYKVVIF